MISSNYPSIPGVVCLEDVSGEMLGFLPCWRLFPEAIRGPAGLEDLLSSVLIWENLYKLLISTRILGPCTGWAQHPKLALIICCSLIHPIKTTSIVSTQEMTATYWELIVIEPKTQVQHWEKKTCSTHCQIKTQSHVWSKNTGKCLICLTHKCTHTCEMLTYVCFWCWMNVYTNMHKNTFLIFNECQTQHNFCLFDLKTNKTNYEECAMPLMTVTWLVEWEI